MCCHHLCTWADYVGQPFFTKRLGLGPFSRAPSRKLLSTGTEAARPFKKTCGMRGRRSRDLGVRVRVAVGSHVPRAPQSIVLAVCFGFEPMRLLLLSLLCLAKLSCVVMADVVCLVWRAVPADFGLVAKACSWINWNTETAEEGGGPPITPRERCAAPPGP